MPDRSAENLERIRACDAEWNENDHPRADNGQFTSGSGGGGVKLSKATSKMKNNGRFFKPAEEAEVFKSLGKSLEKMAQMPDSLGEEHRKLTERHAEYAKAGEKLSRKKEAAAKQALANARPKITAMRQLAKAAAAKPANVKNLKTLLAGPSSMNELFEKYKSENNLDDASTVLELSSQMKMNGGDLIKAVHEVRSKFDEMNDNKWMDDDAYERNIASLDRVSGDAWSALEREKRIARGNKIGVQAKKYSDKTKGISEKHAAEQKKQAEKINKAIQKSALAEGFEKQKRADNAVYREQGKLINMQKAQRQEMGEAQKEAKKYNAAKSALAKARPGVQAMRQLAASARPAPAAAHPMVAEVQKDIDYWNQTHYNGRPSEKQKADTIESMRMQYEDAAKSAEKWYNLAKNASGIDPAKVQEFKDKFEKAKGKVEALAQINKPAQAPAAKPAAPNDLQPAPMPKAAKNLSPEQSAAKLSDLAAMLKRHDTEAAKYARKLAKVAANGGEEAVQKWVDNRLKEIDADPEMIPFVKGFHRGRLRMVLEQYNK